MAITLAAFVALQILMPTVIRPHLQPPVTETVAFTAAGARGLGFTTEGVKMEGYTIPGAWVLTSRPDLLDAAGNQVTRELVTDCTIGDFDKDMACLEAKNLHVSVSYQPANRYWTFQWLEFAAYLVLAGLLAGFAFWRIPRGLS